MKTYGRRGRVDAKGGARGWALMGVPMLHDESKKWHGPLSLYKAPVSHATPKMLAHMLHFEITQF